MRNPFDPGYYRSDELRGFGFAAIGANVSIARNCTITGLANISLGDDVRIDGLTTIIASTGRLRLGNRVHIGGGCHFSCADDLTFGDISGTSQGVKIYTATDNYSGLAMAGPMVPRECTRPRRAPVHIGRHTIIGAGSVILPGAHVGEGSTVGALSLVTKPCAEWSMYFGIPAKRLKGRKRVVLDLEARMIEADALRLVA